MATDTKDRKDERTTNQPHYKAVDPKYSYCRRPSKLASLRFRKPYHDKTRGKTVLATPDRVKEFAEAVFKDAMANPDQPLVIAIGCGGTISMTKNKKGRRVPDLNIKRIVKLADQRIDNRYQLYGFDAIKSDSSQMEIDDAADLSVVMSYIWEKMPEELKKNFAGFTVMHGTDTMSKDIAHVTTMLGPNRPFNIAFTGSQVPIDEFSNDAGTNVKHTLLTLETLWLSGKAESVLVAGGVAIAGLGSRKISDKEARAFDSPLHEVIIDFGSNPDPRRDLAKIKLPSWLRRRPSVANIFEPMIYRGVNTVGHLRPEMSEDPDALRKQIEGRSAILIDSYGASTFDMGQAKLIGDYCKEHNIPVFALSPVFSELDFETYAMGSALAEAAGATPILMTADAARAKLMVAKGICNKYGHDYKEFVTTFMTQDYLGEIPHAHALEMSQRAGVIGRGLTN